jgi:hypothetical protein
MIFRHKKLVAMLALAVQGIGGFGGFAAKAGAAEASDEAAETVVSSGFSRNEADSDSVPLPETGDETGLDSRLLPHGAKLGIHIAGVGLIAGIIAIATRGFGLLCEKNKDTIGSHEQLPDQQSENNVMRNIKLIMTNQEDGKTCDDLVSIFKYRIEAICPENQLMASRICFFGAGESGFCRLVNYIFGVETSGIPTSAEYKRVHCFTQRKYYNFLLDSLLFPRAFFGKTLNTLVGILKYSTLVVFVFSKGTDVAQFGLCINLLRQAAPAATIVLVETVFGDKRDNVSTVHNIVKLLDDSNLPRERLFYYTADLDNLTSKLESLPDV